MFEKSQTCLISGVLILQLGGGTVEEVGGGSGGWRGARGGGALHQAATAGVRHSWRARGVARYELNCLHHLRTNTTCKCTTTDSSPHMIPSSEQQAGGWISVHNTVLSGVDCTFILNPWFLKDGVGRVYGRVLLQDQVMPEMEAGGWTRCWKNICTQWWRKWLAVKKNAPHFIQPSSRHYEEWIEKNEEYKQGRLQKKSKTYWSDEIDGW